MQTVVKHGSHDQKSHGRGKGGSEGDNSSTVSSGTHTSVLDGVPFRSEHIREINDYMGEPDPPATLYHVAPKSARERISEKGLDPADRTHNTGAGLQETYRDEHLWTKDEVGEEFAYEYRPEGIYLFPTMDQAERYAGDSGDIYKVDVKANGREIARDPSVAMNWDYLDVEDQAYVTRYVEPAALTRVEHVAKHGSHDQKSHGRGGGAREVAAKDVDSAWDAVLSDEARTINDPKKAHPEKYDSRGKLKDGEVETRRVRGEGPPRVRDYETNESVGLSWSEAAKVEGALGLGETGDFTMRVPTGPARPPQHVYRVMSTAEFDQARERGYIKSDERMNLAAGEGTVTSLRSTGDFYAPVDGSSYRVVRIKYDDADGWRTDTDGYIKTQDRVPFDRVDLYSSPLDNPRVTKDSSQGQVVPSVRLDFAPGLRPVLKHGSHDQKAHGRRGGGLSSGRAADIIADVRADGGLTVNMVDGSKPTGGYMVAVGGTTGSIVSEADFFDPQKGPEALGSYFKEHKAALSGGTYLGVWHNKDDGQVYLDLSENIMDQAEAISLGSERDQISIWDVANFEEIDTGGTGQVGKAVAGSENAGSVEDDGRGDRRLRKDRVGEGGRAAVVYFEPGLRPVLKHGSHDQSSHGRRGTSYGDWFIAGAEAEYRRREAAITRGDFSGYNLGESRLIARIGGGIGRMERRIREIAENMGIVKRPPRSYTAEEAMALRRQYEELG